MWNSAREYMWLSSFLLKAFVNLVNRRFCILTLRFCRQEGRSFKLTHYLGSGPVLGIGSYSLMITGVVRTEGLEKGRCLTMRSMMFQFSREWGFASSCLGNMGSAGRRHPSRPDTGGRASPRG